MFFLDRLIAQIAARATADQIGPDQKSGRARLNSFISPAGVIRAIIPTRSVNQIFPSGPAVIKVGRTPGGSFRSATTPAGVTRKILPPPAVTQRLPSGPAAIRSTLDASGIGNSVISPAVVIRPIRLPLNSVNHRFPSGSRSDFLGLRIGRRHGEFRDSALRCDTPDARASFLGEPEIPIGSRRDPGRTAVGVGDRELGDRSRRRHAPDPIRS